MVTVEIALCHSYSTKLEIVIRIEKTECRHFDQNLPSFPAQLHSSNNVWPTNSQDLNQVCSVLQEKVYPSSIANVDELKTRPIDEWEHFHPSIVGAAIAEWWHCLSACVRVSGAHFEHQFQRVYKFSYFVIYLPQVIKLIES